MPFSCLRATDCPPRESGARRSPLRDRARASPILRVSDEAPGQTITLLRRWHAGDNEALGALVARDLPWIRARVHRQLGAEMRKHTDVEDVVQDAMLAALENSPRFLISDTENFRALLARIVENVIRMRHRYVHQERRDIGRQQRIPDSDTVLDLDASATRPSQAAVRSETQAWMQLCIDILDPRDRDVILLRQWKELSFVQIGEQLGIDQAAARMRFERALARLAKLVKRVQGGGLSQVLSESSGA